MKKLLLLLFCGFSILSYSQDQKFKISLQRGWMSAGDIYKLDRSTTNIQQQSGWNVGADISYFITDRFFAGVHFNYGCLVYDAYVWYPNIISSTYVRKNIETSGTMEINNIGLFAGYCLPLSPLFNVTGQIGFAQFIQLDAYPKMEYIPDERYSEGYHEEIDRSASWNHIDLSLPVKFSLGVTPFKKLNIGLAKNIEIAYVLGWYIEPDYGFFAGIYHGPQLSISF